MSNIRRPRPLRQPPQAQTNALIERHRRQVVRGPLNPVLEEHLRQPRRPPNLGAKPFIL